MVYSYYGEIETRELALGIQYKVAKFEFQTPILINGSAEVKLSGLHSLFVSSDEGIYIGVDVAVGKPKGNEDKAVGGYCVRNSQAPGNTLYYSFKIFPRFWLVKTTRIIHHNQLLMTNFGKNLRHIESMTSEVEPSENYWTIDVKMTSKVQPAADYIEPLTAKTWGQRSVIFGERKN